MVCFAIQTTWGIGVMKVRKPWTAPYPTTPRTSKSRNYWVICSELECMLLRVFDVLKSCDLQAKLTEM